jgi:hypothetical protein
MKILSNKEYQRLKACHQKSVDLYGELQIAAKTIIRLGAENYNLKKTGVFRNEKGQFTVKKLAQSNDN